MLRTRIATAVGVAALVLSSPAVAGASHTPHSPDALDRAAAAEAARNHLPPDARDRATAAEGARRLRDAGLESRSVAAPQPPAQVAAVDPPSGSFRWDDAGIGAAAMLGLICALAAALLLVPHGRGRSAPLRH